MGQQNEPERRGEREPLQPAGLDPPPQDQAAGDVRGGGQQDERQQMRSQEQCELNGVLPGGGMRLASTTRP